MRPGFIIGVFAFGLLMTALFVAFAVWKAMPAGQIVKFSVLVFAVFTLFPMGYGALTLPGAEVVQGLDRRNAKLAAAVFVFLVLAAVATFLVIHTMG